MVIRIFASILVCCALTISCAEDRSGPASPEKNRSDSLFIPLAQPDEAVGSRPVKIPDLITLREIGRMLGEGLSISPDGHYMAFEAHQADISADSYNVAWFVAPLKVGAEAVNVGNGGDPLLFQNPQGAWSGDTPQWSTDSRWIYYRRMVSGETQVWRSNKTGGLQEQVTNLPADVVSFQLTPDGRSLFATTDAPRAEITVLKRQSAGRGYLVDDALFNPFYEAKPHYPPYYFAGGPQVWKHDLENGGFQKATDGELAEYRALVGATELLERPAAQQVVYSKNLDSVAWLENPDPEKYPGMMPPLNLYAATRQGIADAVECQARACAGGIRRLWWFGPDELVFQRNEDYGWRAFYGWTPGTGTIRRIYATNDWISSCSMVEERLVCFLESPSYPRQIVSLDLGTGELSTLVDPNPEFKGIRLSDVEHMVWENEFGERTWGYLVKPLDYDPGKRYPLIIVQYSPDDCLRGGTGDEFPTHAFAANGIAVLCFRQTVDWIIYETLTDPHAILRAEYDDFAKHRQSLSSLEVIIDTLTQRGLVDPQRVGLTGLSAGVEVLQYALIHSKAFAAAATSGGGAEPISYFGSTASSRDSFFQPLDFGNLYTEGEGGNWPEWSLALNAEKIDTAFLIQAADREYLHSIQTAITWIVAGNAIEMRVFPDEHHVKWHPAHRLHVYERNVDWFNFWLRGVEDNNPDKADQYTRWRAMREKQCTRRNGGDELWYCEKGEVN